MAGVSGGVLVERMRQTLPNLKVIYMSGYPDSTVADHGIVESSISFLQKPFSMASLADKIGLTLAGG
jgi:FixJ family two-component response regulator